MNIPDLDFSKMYPLNAEGQFDFGQPTHPQDARVHLRDALSQVHRARVATRAQCGAGEARLVFDTEQLSPEKLFGRMLRGLLPKHGRHLAEPSLSDCFAVIEKQPALLAYLRDRSPLGFDRPERHAEDYWKFLSVLEESAVYKYQGKFFVYPELWPLLLWENLGE